MQRSSSSPFDANTSIIPQYVNHDAVTITKQKIDSKLLEDIVRQQAASKINPLLDKLISDKDLISNKIKATTIVDDSPVKAHKIITKYDEINNLTSAIIAANGKKIELELKKDPVTSSKNNFFSTIAAKIRNFYKLHATKTGRLELKEKHIISKINQLENKLSRSNDIISKKLGDITFVDKSPEKAKIILSKYNSLLKKHENACEELDKVRGKIKELDKAKHGYERVQQALNIIENESKIESARQDASKTAYERLRDSLKELRKEYPDVFTKHSELNEQYARIKAQQVQIIYRSQMTELKAKKQNLRVNLKDITAQKNDLLKIKNENVSKNEDLQSHFDHSNDKNDRLNTELNTINTNIKKLDALQIKAMKDNDSMQNELKLYEKLLKAKLNEAVNLNVDESEEKKFVYKLNLNSCRLACINYQRNILTLRDTIAKNNNYIASLQTELVTLYADEALLNQEIETLSNEIKAQKLELNTNSKAIKTTVSKINNINKKMKTAKQELNDTTSEIDRIEPKLKTAPMRERENMAKQEEINSHNRERMAKLEEINNNNEHIRQALQLAEEHGIELSDSTMNAYKAKVQKLEDQYQAI